MRVICTIAVLSCFAGVAIALPTDTQYEVRNGGSDGNGGCFSPANQGGTGTDHTYPTPNAVTLAGTLSAPGGGFVITASVASFDNTMLGNCMAVSGQGLFVIATFTDSTHVSVNNTTATFSGASGIVGGAMATPGFACGLLTGSQTVWVKYNASPFAMSASSNVTGGKCGMPTLGTVTTLRGYEATRGDHTANRPIFQATADTMILVGTGAANVVDNLKLDCNSHATTTGLALGVNQASNITVVGACTGSGISMTGGSIVGCEVSGMITSPAIALSSSGGGSVSYCSVHDNSVAGISVGVATSLRRNLVYNNTGDGITISTSGTLAENNTSYNNAGNGFLVTGSGLRVYLINNYAEGNTGGGHYGFQADNATNSAYLWNCGAFNNAAGDFNTNFFAVNVTGFQSLSSTAFVNAAGGNFAPNNITGGGRNIRAAGFPAAIAPGTTAEFLDIGVAQTNGAASGQVAFGSAH